MNFARLNHILIPDKAKADRLRDSWFGRFLRPLERFILSLSDEGRLLLLFLFVTSVSLLNLEQTQLYLLWSVMIGLLAAALLFRRWVRLSDVRVFLDYPRRVTVGEPISFTIQLHNMGATAYRQIRINRRPFLPWDGKYVGAVPSLPALPGNSQRQLTVRARFVHRGEHHLDSFHIAPLVPLGLTVGPSLASADIRFFVIPKIAPITKLTTPVTHRYQPGGVALASQIGESLELVGVRPYVAGDPIRELHAKTWARLGYPAVREYRQEYFTRIGVVLDTDFGDAREKTSEAAISLAAGVVAYLSRGEALIDVLLIGDKIHQLTLGRSLGFLDQALDLLSCVAPGPSLEPANALHILSPFLKQLSCVIVISLKWNRSLALFADQIRARGVGCKVLHVAKAAASDSLSGGDDMVVVPDEKIGTTGLVL